MPGAQIYRSTFNVYAFCVVILVLLPYSCLAQNTTSRTFCYSTIEGVACYSQDANGRTQKVDPPAPSGGQFSQEDGYSYTRRRFGSCSDTKKALCDYEAKLCSEQALLETPRSKAQELLKRARNIPAYLGAPAGEKFHYDFSYNLTCEGKDLAREPHVCEHYISCRIRGDFTY